MEFIWILCAFAFGLLFKGANLPPLIGYLLAGFLLNFSGVQPEDNLQLIANIGITLMLFTIGLELNTNDLFKTEVWFSATSHLILFCTIVLVTFLAVSFFALNFFTQLEWKTALLISFALAFSSTICVVKLLQTHGELKTRHGRLAIGVLIVQDIAAVVFLVAISQSTLSYWSLILVLLWWARPFFEKLLQYAGHNELLPLAGFFFAFGGYELFQLVGIKGDLGALVFGILLGSSNKSIELSKSLLSFKDLFLIPFFLTIGFAALPDWSMLLAAFVLVTILLLKFLLFFFIFALLKLRARTSFLSAMLLANFSEFGLIVLAISSRNGLVNQEWLVIVALAVSLSFIVTSSLYSYAHQIYTRHKTFIKPFETRLRLKEDLYILPNDANIIIIGMGRVGVGAYKALQQILGEKIWGLDANKDRVKDKKRMGFQVFSGDAEDPDLWESLDLKSIRLVLLTLPSTLDSENITRQLRQANYQGKIAAITRYEDQKDKLLHIGIDKVFNFYSEAGTGFAEESLQLIEHYHDYGNNWDEVLDEK
ncbi:MAG: cation:proton antiporter [Gammaproteobacteria bacterium]|nr:cation:proton antiporter [Gammaproteobacteria bacterium]MDH5629278.1 cation:proton antiporter [Gammaproteobacteria bacterium]